MLQTDFGFFVCHKRLNKTNQTQFIKSLLQWLLVKGSKKGKKKTKQFQTGQNFQHMLCSSSLAELNDGM